MLAEHDGIEQMALVTLWPKTLGEGKKFLACGLSDGAFFYGAPPFAMGPIPRAWYYPKAKGSCS
jgi:hypothetical protein